MSKVRKSLYLILLLSLIGSGLQGTEKGILLLADFNSGKKPSNIGGDFGAWEKDPQDFSETCQISFSKNVRKGEKGYSLRIDYDVDSPRPAWNGVWFKLEKIDFRPFDTLNFWIKGDTKRGFTKVFKIELKNSSGEVGKKYITEVSSEWKKISIPFEDFLGITDFSSMEELVIVFEDRIATRKVGTLYLDDIYLSREEK